MFKKNKKLIAIILVFTISFTSYTLVQEKQVQAIAVVDDITLYLILATVVVATGYVATSKGQASHMGSMLWDSFKSIGGTMEDLVTETYEGVQGLKIGDKIKEAMHLAFDDIQAIKEVYNVRDSAVVSGFSPSYFPKATYEKIDEVNKICTFYFQGSLYLNNYYAGGSGSSPVKVTLGVAKYSSNKVLAFFGDSTNAFSTSTFSGSWFSFSANNITNFQVFDRISLEDIGKENASIDKLDISIPYTDTNSGFIPVPTDTTRYDTITHDTPLTWDSVKDLVIDFPVDTTVDDDIVVPPPVIDGDITGDGTIVGDDTIVGDGTLVGEGTLDVPKVAKLDFSPLYINLKDKFPFCIPFDLYNMVAGFNAPKVAPHFTITFPEETMVGGGSFDFNFDNYSKIVLIFRYFILLTFLVNLIKISRKVMGAE